MRTFLLFVVLCLGAATRSDADEAPLPTVSASPSSSPTAAPSVAPLPAPQPSASAPAAIDITRIEGSTVYFNDAKLPALKTSLFDLQRMGILRHPMQPLPYLLLSGMSCQNCSAHRMLYLIRADGKYPLTLVYPGRIKDRKKGTLVFEGRGFFGDCVSGREAVYLMFQKEKVDRRRFLQQSAFVAEVAEHGVDEKLIIRRMPSLTHVLRQVKRKKCFELPSIDRQSVKFSIKPDKRGEKSEEAFDEEEE